MSEDPTIPMEKARRSGHEPDLDEQETLLSEDGKGRPPAEPRGDQGGWSPAPDRGFMRTVPGEAITPPPFPSPQAPFGPPGPEERTMIIGERPTPVFAWLAVLDGPDRNAIGTIRTLHPDTTTIGRLPDNKIVLNDETVSGQHARIRHEAREEEQSVFVLFDMGSRNGIFIGDRDSYKNEESRVYRHQLKDGDYLLIGETTLVFKQI
jgi:hypothetical protein